MSESSSNSWKTLWEKEKLHVTSNFSFSHSFFKSLVLQTRKNKGLFGKGLNIFFYNKPSVLHHKKTVVVCHLSLQQLVSFQRHTMLYYQVTLGSLAGNQLILLLSKVLSEKNSKSLVI